MLASVGIEVFGALLSAVLDARPARELAAPHLLPGLAASVLAQRRKLTGIGIPGGAHAGVAAAPKHATRVSFVAGFRRVMALSAR